MMESFFGRVSGVWPAGRRDLHWHILPTPDETAELIAPYKGISGPGLSRVPADWMHCTLLHAVGLGRDAVDIDALLDDVQTSAQNLEPVILTFDRPYVGAVAVEVSGWPGSPFRTLVDTVSEATARTGAAHSAAPSRYPHMSLGYTTADADALDAVALRAALSEIEQPLSATVVANRIHLVEQWHDGEYIRWTPIAEVPLLGART
ncbi:2'-5' RNA ligase family protein [Streptomyces solisilvae]|uniref:2'-5' RNA ligase family protein n=1 Tax=Streptomyces malaysiensis TaxID=92644 RepID=UPI0036B63D2E